MRRCSRCGQSIGLGFFCGCGYGYDELGMGGLGVDVTDGDLVENLGDGLGVNLDTGQVELDEGGFDFPL
jgi:hypothetical protein